MLEQMARNLNQVYDDLVEAKNELEVQLEDNKKKHAVQEEQQKKRMKTKLSRDNNVELKDLQSQIEMVRQMNEDTDNKVKDEKQKLDQLT